MSAPPAIQATSVPCRLTDLELHFCRRPAPHGVRLIKVGTFTVHGDLEIFAL